MNTSGKLTLEEHVKDISGKISSGSFVLRKNLWSADFV